MALNLALIPGDGTGPEVVREAIKVLDHAAQQTGLSYTTTEYDLGGERYLRTGEVINDDDLEQLRRHDAILLGALGHPNVKPGVLERGILLTLRFRFDQFINLRPVKLYPGIDTPIAGKGPDEIDMVVVRENTEDLYVGAGGIMRKDTPQEIATQQMIATRFGVERCVRYAFDLARARKAQGYAGRLTLVHKTNVLTYAGDTWFRAFQQIGDADYPDIERDYHHVDACCMYLATRPEVYDTVVTPNMFGDIITDLGAAIAGGMGIAASGNLNPRFAPGSAETSEAGQARGERGPSESSGSGGPSMFEPVHGSSPDIAGQDKANPLATIDTLAMLLRETGKQQSDAAMLEAADLVANAVQQVTPNFAGKPLDRSGYSTTQIGDMAVEALGARAAK